MDQETSETAESSPPLDPQSLFHPGTIAERVDFQLGLLTQGVANCMILATGAFPGLTEDPAPEAPFAGYGGAPIRRPVAASATSWSAPALANCAMPRGFPKPVPAS